MIIPGPLTDILTGQITDGSSRCSGGSIGNGCSDGKNGDSGLAATIEKASAFRGAARVKVR